MHKGDTLQVNLHSRLMHWYRWQPYRLPLFNELARTAMQVKFTAEPLMLQWQWAKKQAKVDEFFAEKKIFFGLSTFRSGSTFLADLLANEVNNAQIEHEPNVNDYWSYAKILKGKKHAFQYVYQYRKQDIVQRSRYNDITIYGELNPFLVLHVNALKEEIPEAVLFHLVRDGRDVVRSLMAREVLGDKDPLAKIITPPADDLYYEKWHTMTRFEKVCWKWQHENKTLRATINHSIQFERLVKDYDYFKKEILNLLNIHITKEKWQYHINQPKHASPRHRIPHWSEWDKQLIHQFEEICGEEMEANGYST